MTVVLSLDGRPCLLEVDRWHAPATAAERQLLRGLAGPVLDIGCGPGRLVVALAEQRIPAMGIDSSPHAIRSARSRGACVLRRSVFDRLPREGRWRAALLLDGNIGIGGDPTALLARTAELLAPRGRAVVEVEAPGQPSITGRADLREDGRIVTRRFPWSRLGADDLARHASAAGLVVRRRDVVDGRFVVTLVRS